MPLAQIRSKRPFPSYDMMAILDMKRDLLAWAVEWNSSGDKDGLIREVESVIGSIEFSTRHDLGKFEGMTLEDLVV